MRLDARGALPVGFGAMRFWEQPRQPCIGLFFCAAAGILCAEYLPCDARWISMALIFSAAAWLRWRAQAIFWPALFLAFFLLHDLNSRESPGRRLAALLGAQPRVVSGAAIVTGEPKPVASPSGKFPRWRFTTRLEKISAAGVEQATDAQALVVWAGAPPRYGDRIAFTGDIQDVPPARNPGQFDAASYFRRLGIFSEIHLRYPSDGAVLAHDCGNWFIAFSHAARGWMQRKLTLDLTDSPEIAGLAQSLVLGLKEETPPETRELFQRTGTLHLFVVNGLHVGMFACISAFILKPLGVRRRALAVALIALLIFYATVTGLSPGSIRATIMAAVVLGASFADRSPVSMNSLFAAGFAMLTWDTNELFMPGFQFSFGVVFTIILLAGRIHARLLPLAAPDSFLPRSLWSRAQVARVATWRRVSALVAVTTAASLGSTPFTATYFHLVSPSALLANLVIVPLAFGVLFQGVFAMLAGAVSNSVCALFNNVNWLLANGVLALVHGFAALPGGYIFVEMPKKHAVCELTVFDLGGGGAIALRCEGRHWLFDTGRQFGYENVVRQFLHMRGVNRLDGLLLTHGDVAHLGAAISALDDFRPHENIDSPLRDRSPGRRAWQARLAADGLPRRICASGDIVQLSKNVSARVLYPPPALHARTADDKALVLQLAACGTRVLLMSDSGFLTERWLLDHARESLRSDILVKGQHAADLSGTPDFLAAVRPSALVCSGANFPPAERVSEEWARDVTARDIALFRQDKTGAVEIEIAREEWRARAFLGDQVFTSRTR